MQILKTYGMYLPRKSLPNENFLTAAVRRLSCGGQADGFYAAASDVAVFQDDSTPATLS